MYEAIFILATLLLSAISIHILSRKNATTDTSSDLQAFIHRLNAQLKTDERLSLGQYTFSIDGWGTITITYPNKIQDSEPLELEDEEVLTSQIGAEYASFIRAQQLILDRSNRTVYLGIDEIDQEKFLSNAKKLLQILKDIGNGQKN